MLYRLLQAFIDRGGGGLEFEVAGDAHMPLVDAEALEATGVVARLNGEVINGGEQRAAQTSQSAQAPKSPIADPAVDDHDGKPPLLYRAQDQGPEIAFAQDDSARLEVTEESSYDRSQVERQVGYRGSIAEYGARPGLSGWGYGGDEKRYLGWKRPGENRGNADLSYRYRMQPDSPWAALGIAKAKPAGKRREVVPTTG